MASQQTEQSIARYNIHHWGENYFDINEEGRLTVCLNDGQRNHNIELSHIMAQAKQQGLDLPLLLRFKSILRDRVFALKQAFGEAFSKDQCDSAQYLPVYPIKVNQQRSVVEQICLASLSEAKPAAGLECGSKAELLAVLGVLCQCAQSYPQAELTIVCNGYKDRDYLSLALMGEKMGFRVFIVIERLSELENVLALAEEMQVSPRLGLRVRLSTLGKGKWQNSGGEKSKFGLTPVNLLEALNRLKSCGKEECLQLLHFHIGSQIANIHDIHKGLKEAAQYYCEITKLGFKLQWLDVGGGLGVDYEGSRSRRYCSMNYDINEYARNIVHTLKSVCQHENVPFPNIITEAGRAMTAHHAVILSEVFDSESVSLATPKAPEEGSPEVLQRMWQNYQLIKNKENPNLLELYHALCEGLEELRGAYVHGLISLEQRADGEKIQHSALMILLEKLKPNSRSSNELIEEIKENTADKLFINLSVFRSLPDVWGIDQVFPVVPLHNLNKALTRRVVLQDVTCDSDGRIDQYIDGEDIETSLPVSEENVAPGALYGFFLAGAYQEILGDNHNLFGETDTVDVEVDRNGEIMFSHPEKGDSISSVLESVHFSAKSLNDLYQSHVDGLDIKTYAKQQLQSALSAATLKTPYLLRGDDV
jgi:arginine decarboxylase